MSKAKKYDGPTIMYRDFHLPLDLSHLTYAQKSHLAWHLLMSGELKVSVCGTIKLMLKPTGELDDIQFGQVEPTLGCHYPWDEVPKTKPVARYSVDKNSIHKKDQDNGGNTK